GNRPETVVPGQTTACASLKPGRLEIDVVVDDKNLLNRCLEERAGRGQCAAGVVHVGLRLEQCDPRPLDPGLCEASAELRLERGVVTASELVDHHPADVVAIALVLATGIPEPDHEQIERRGRCAPTEE